MFFCPSICLCIYFNISSEELKIHILKELDIEQLWSWWRRCSCMLYLFKYLEKCSLWQPIQWWDGQGKLRVLKLLIKLQSTRLNRRRDRLLWAKWNLYLIPTTFKLLRNTVHTIDQNLERLKYKLWHHLGELKMWHCFL